MEQVYGRKAFPQIAEKLSHGPLAERKINQMTLSSLARFVIMDIAGPHEHERSFSEQLSPAVDGMEHLSFDDHE